MQRRVTETLRTVAGQLGILAEPDGSIVIFRVTVRRPLTRRQRCRLFVAKLLRHQHSEENEEVIDCPVPRQHALGLARAIYAAATSAPPVAPAGPRPS